MIASPILLILTSIWKRLDAASTVFDIVWLNDTNSDPLAVCNDGSSAAYYYSSALTTGL